MESSASQQQPPYFINKKKCYSGPSKEINSAFWKLWFKNSFTPLGKHSFPFLLKDVGALKEGDLVTYVKKDDSVKENGSLHKCLLILSIPRHN